MCRGLSNEKSFSPTLFVVVLLCFYYSAMFIINNFEKIGPIKRHIVKVLSSSLCRRAFSNALSH